MILGLTISLDGFAEDANGSVGALYADIAFLLMNMLGDASEKLQYLNRLTIYGFYDPVELVHGGDIMAVNLLYISIIAILFASAVLVFKKKRLPL